MTVLVRTLGTQLYRSGHGPPRASSSGAQVVIRRPAQVKLRPRIRRQFSDPAGGEPAERPAPGTSEAADLLDTASRMSMQDEQQLDDEPARIRRLLRPPEIPGVADWGIPPSPSTPCDPALEVGTSGAVGQDGLLTLCGTDETSAVHDPQTRLGQPQTL